MRTANGIYTASGTDFEVASADSDPFDANDVQKLAAALRDHAHENTRGNPIKRVQSGTFAARPAAGNAGHVYVATDTASIYFDTGAAWVKTLSGSIITADLASNAVNVLQLNYIATTNIANLSAIAAATWTDLGTNQSFTVAGPTSLVSIEVGGNVGGVSPASASGIAARIVIDSAGVAPINAIFSGGFSYASQYTNFFAGAKPIKVTGLAAGSHTVKVQLWSAIAGTVICRPTTDIAESLLISVVESKR
ncbi:MAG TPA: hypothetical protein VNM48_02085 [Chloroflexota bacterium]|nr:hypothetical protein [Chloroflexota bacterium]